jgi:hypothetical protein
MLGLQRSSIEVRVFAGSKSQRLLEKSSIRDRRETALREKSRP